jgi:hypothetical protein
MIPGVGMLMYPHLVAENKTRGRYKKGQSGNPRGRARGSRNKPRRRTLPLAGTIAAAELARLGASESKIAKLLQARPNAVKDALTEARALLELFAPQAAEHWLEAARVAAANGDHKPAKELMQAIDVVKPPPQTYDTNGPGAKAMAAVKVEFVNFGFAGLPAQTTTPAVTTIDATASST